MEFCAVNHPNDVKGLLLVSTGLSDAVLGIQAQEETHHGILTKYVPDDPYQYILGYPGAVLFICGDADATGAYDNAAFNAVLYQQREQRRRILSQFRTVDTAMAHLQRNRNRPPWIAFCHGWRNNDQI